eukprot:6814548-Prymnesium_polylepis.1
MPARARVLDRMRYWHAPLVEQPPSSQYLTFTPDCGGFNNIRMGFEFAVLVAFATRRTLVLPPPQPWYLIDFGPRTRMKPDPGKPWEGSTSGFELFFNMSVLRAHVPVLTAAQFVLRERALLSSEALAPLVTPLVDAAARRASAGSGDDAAARAGRLAGGG